MAFFLFILVNATLFIRPAEIVPALLGRMNSVALTRINRKKAMQLPRVKAISDKRLEGSLGGFARGAARNRRASFSHALECFKVVGRRRQLLTLDRAYE